MGAQAEVVPAITTTETTPSRGAPARRTVLVFGAATALLALGVYWRTLYPGLVGAGDTPKFQYLGRILGTAHPPGYPLYVVLSHAFSHLPIGSLAYRMNLLSACFGALAAAFAFLVERRLGVPPALAAAIALALAFGRTFWSQATLAEVYTLAAAILLAIVWMLLAWAETRRPRWLLGAVAISALGLGHHLTLVTFFPAFVLFALVTDARAVLHPRRLLAGALLFALGLAQYGFIILRTLQRAPYLGCGATNLRELAAVLRGDVFQRHLFTFDLWTLWSARVPLVARLVGAELRWAGVLLALAGLIWMARRQRRVALLVVVALGGILFFVLNYDVPDLAVFAIPIFLMLWIAAGFALAGIVACVRRRWGRWAALSASVIVFALPAEQLRANFTANDHSDRTFESRYFRALFASLPRRVAFVAENHAVDQMVLYMLHGEGWEERLDARLAPPYAPQIEGYLREGRAVYAFADGLTRLEEHGQFIAAPVRLLDQPLESALRVMPSQRVVIAAAGGADGSIEELSRVAGAQAGRTTVALGVGGLWSDQVGDALTRQPGAPIGGGRARSPARLAAFGGPLGARIVIGSQAVSETDSGILVVVLSPAGKVVDSHTLRAEERWRVPFSSRTLPIWHVERTAPCAVVTDQGPVDVSGEAASGRLRVRVDNVHPFETTVDLALRSDRPLDPRLGHCEGVEAPRLTVEALAPARRSPSLTRLRLALSARGGAAGCVLMLGGMPLAASAQAGGDRTRALVCGLPAAGRDSLAPLGPRAATIFVGPERASLGAGWGEAVEAGPLSYRAITSDAAEVLLSLAHVREVQVSVRARARQASALALNVNGMRGGSAEVAGDWSTISWRVPAEGWRLGPNRLLLSPSSRYVDVNYVRVQ